MSIDEQSLEAARNDPVAVQFVNRVRRPKEPDDPVRHHYIPQFLLERFAQSRKICRTSLLVPEDSHVVSVKDAAVISNFYTVKDPDAGDTVMVEKLLAAVEGNAAPVVRNLTFECNFPLRGRARENMLLWIAFQMVRDPGSRVLIQTLTEYFFKRDFSTINSEEQAEALLNSRGVQASDKEIRKVLDFAKNLKTTTIQPHQNNLILQMLTSSREMYSRLLGLEMSLIKFSDPGLILPDRCVAPIVPHDLRNFLSYEPGFLVPLDRRTLLVIQNNQWTDDIIRISDPCIQHQLNQILATATYGTVFVHPEDERLLGKLRFRQPNGPLLSVLDQGSFPSHTRGVNSTSDGRKLVRFAS